LKIPTLCFTTFFSQLRYGVLPPLALAPAAAVALAPNAPLTSLILAMIQVRPCEGVNHRNAPTSQK
jgi:hypothetical protein